MDFTPHLVDLSSMVIDGYVYMGRISQTASNSPTYIPHAWCILYLEYYQMYYKGKIKEDY